MMMTSSSQGSSHVALPSPELDGIPAQAWNLQPWPPAHNPCHTEICKRPSHAFCLHIDLPVDGRPCTHLIHPLHLKAPPPPIVVLVLAMFQKGLAASRNIATKHGPPKWPNVPQHGIYIMLKAQ